MGATSTTLSAVGYPAGDFAGKHLLSNGYYSTPNGGTTFLGYVDLGADGTADIVLSTTAAGNTSDALKHHNAMRLTPGILPPYYDPGCEPGPIRAGQFTLVQRTGSWALDGYLKVLVPGLEADDDFSFEWAVETGSQVRSLILRRVINVTRGWGAGDPYGYGFLSANSPRSLDALSAGQFAPYYASTQSTHEPGGWSTIWPEYSDAYIASLGGFFPTVPGFLAPPIQLGYYRDADPSVWTRTLLVQDAQSTYGAHTLLFNYADVERPFVSNTLMFFHGGHDFSDNGCYGWGEDGGHVLAILGVLEGGTMTKMVVVETGIGGLYHLGRLHAVEYPTSGDLIFADGFEAGS